MKELIIDGKKNFRYISADSVGWSVRYVGVQMVVELRVADTKYGGTILLFGQEPNIALQDPEIPNFFQFFYNDTHVGEGYITCDVTPKTNETIAMLRYSEHAGKAKNPRKKRRKGDQGGCPLKDEKEQVDRAVLEVIRMLKNKLRMKRACELACEEIGLSIKWQALQVHVKKLLAKKKDV